MVEHTKNISSVEQLVGVAQASGTASGFAPMRTSVPGSFTESLFIILGFVVFGDLFCRNITSLQVFSLSSSD